LPDLSQLDLFYGELTVNQASIYARLPRPDDDEGLRITGRIHGPRSFNSRTLPASTHLFDLGPGPTLLARATLTDPTFWSSDLPAIYDAVVELRQRGQVIDTARREIGLRPLGVRGRHFLLQGKPWVMRGVSAASASVLLPREWHSAAAVFVPEQMDARLAEASQRGATSVIELSGPPDEILAQLRIFAMFPAASLAVIHGRMPSSFAIKGVAPNVLIGQPVDRIREFTTQPWTNFIWAETTDPAVLTPLAASSDRPIVAVRRLPAARTITEARAACDELQRDLAPIGQFAGYVV
jgi:hypothetical protein